MAGLPVDETKLVGLLADRLMLAALPADKKKLARLSADTMMLAGLPADRINRLPCRLIGLC
jgi:hypothetical protein